MRRGIGGRARARLAAALLSLAALAAAAVVGSPASSAQEEAARGVATPNVVVILTDDQRVADTAIALPRTIRKIGRRGADFREAFATFPLCCPSRASLLTGKYAHNHDVLGNNPPDGGMAAYRGTIHEATSTAVALDQAGYRTAWVGKYLNAYLQDAREKPPYVSPGYDYWRAASAPRIMYGWEQVINGRLKRWGRSDRDYQTDVYARQASRFVAAAAKKGAPFFLTVAPTAPHVETRGFKAPRNPRPARRHRNALRRQPLPRPRNMNERDVSDKPSFIANTPRLTRARREKLRDLNRDRLASLLAVDDLVVRLMKTLREQKVLGETLVIFTSDNGYLLGEHRQVGKSKFYDASTKVPLMMRGPGIAKRQVVRSPVAIIDIAATIYDFTGVDPLPQVELDGISLLDVVADPNQYSDRELVLQTGRGFALRTPDWLYTEQQGDDDPGLEFELYELGRDPFQLRSLHNDPDYLDERLELAARLAELRDCEGDQCH